MILLDVPELQLITSVYTCGAFFVSRRLWSVHKFKLPHKILVQTLPIDYFYRLRFYMKTPIIRACHLQVKTKSLRGAISTEKSMSALQASPPIGWLSGSSIPAEMFSLNVSIVYSHLIKIVTKEQ